MSVTNENEKVWYFEVCDHHFRLHRAEYRWICIKCGLSYDVPPFKLHDGVTPHRFSILISEIVKGINKYLNGFRLDETRLPSGIYVRYRRYQRLIRPGSGIRKVKAIALLSLYDSLGAGLRSSRKFRGALRRYAKEERIYKYFRTYRRLVRSSQGKSGHHPSPQFEAPFLKYLHVILLVVILVGYYDELKKRAEELGVTVEFRDGEVVIRRENKTMRIKMPGRLMLESNTIGNLVFSLNSILRINGLDEANYWDYEDLNLVNMDEVYVATQEAIDDMKKCDWCREHLRLSRILGLRAIHFEDTVLVVAPLLDVDRDKDYQLDDISLGSYMRKIAGQEIDYPIFNLAYIDLRWNYVEVYNSHDAVIDWHVWERFAEHVARRLSERRIPFALSWC